MKLTIIRHAHAEHRGRTDHARQLSPSGRRQVAELKSRLDDAVRPYVVLHSDAARTTETAILLEFSGQYYSLSELYSGSVEDYLDAIKEYGDDSTVVVGHEPIVSALAAYLTNSDEFFGGVPTATAIVLEGQLAQGGMTVVNHFLAPMRR